VAEVNNLPYDARITRPAEVAVYGGNAVNIAFMPASRGPALIDELRTIHPYERVYEDVLEAGLSIVNPGVHAGPCLLSVTAIENSPKRPFFLYEHGVTPASCRLNLLIDQERKAIGQRLGYDLTPIEDFTGLRHGYTWQELYMGDAGHRLRRHHLQRDPRTRLVDRGAQLARPRPGRPLRGRDQDLRTDGFLIVPG
jgi:opine dehydrogenase